MPTNVLKEDKELMGRTEEFRLPDGKVIHVSLIRDMFRLGADYHHSQLGSERYWAPEILFNPELIGSEDPGVPQVSLNAVFSYRNADTYIHQDHCGLSESSGP